MCIQHYWLQLGNHICNPGLILITLSTVYINALVYVMSLTFLICIFADASWVVIPSFKMEAANSNEFADTNGK